MFNLVRFLPVQRTEKWLSRGFNPSFKNISAPTLTSTHSSRKRSRKPVLPGFLDLGGALARELMHARTHVILNTLALFRLLLGPPYLVALKL